MTMDELAMLYVLLERFIAWQGVSLISIDFTLGVIKKVGETQPSDPPFLELVDRARGYLKQRGKRGLIGEQ